MRDDSWLYVVLVVLCVALVVELVRLVIVSTTPVKEERKGCFWIVSVYGTEGLEKITDFYGTQRDVTRKIRGCIQADMNVPYVDSERLKSSPGFVVGNSFRKVYDGSSDALGTTQGREWRAEIRK